MQTKEYMLKAFRLNELIESNLRELDNLREMSTYLSGKMTNEKVQSSNRSDTVANAVIKIIQLEQEINKDIDRLIDLKKEVRDIVEKVESDNEKLLLRLRYIEYLSWEEVAEKMNYSLRWVYKLNKKIFSSL